MLWSKSKKIHSMGTTQHSFYIAGEIKVREDSTDDDVNDFEYHFPDVDL